MVSRLPRFHGPAYGRRVTVDIQLRAALAGGDAAGVEAAYAAVDLLVQSGADINAIDARGRTALMYAVERNERTVAGVLLLGGAVRRTDPRPGPDTTSDETAPASPPAGRRPPRLRPAVEPAARTFPATGPRSPSGQRTADADSGPTNARSTATPARSRPPGETPSPPGRTLRGDGERLGVRILDPVVSANVDDHAGPVPPSRSSPERAAADPVHPPSTARTAATRCP